MIILRLCDVNADVVAALCDVNAHVVAVLLWQCCLYLS